MEELLKAHQKEQSELRDRLIQKRKNATKKTRRGIEDECLALEQRLTEKQRAEVAALSPHGSSSDSNAADLSTVSPIPSEPRAGSMAQTETCVPSDTPSGSGPPQPYSNRTPARDRKPNRQKARLARRAAELQAEVDRAAREAACLPDQRQQEQQAMDKELAVRGLSEMQVRSDGHCMYAAVADQMDQKQLPLHTKNEVDFIAVRRDAAAFIQEHPDDFAPFLEEPVADYVAKVRETAEWGGHLELVALARAYGLSINVLEGNGSVETISTSKTPKTEIWLAYYRHSFGLGEHYNSLREIT